MKTRIITTILFMMCCSYAESLSYKLETDTIDYQRTRMYIDIPEISIKMSSLITDCEGFWTCFPIPQNNANPGVLIVDYSVMNINHLLNTKEYDREIWNTLNGNNIGSRCFIKDSLFYRIDKYADGLEIFYENITSEYFDLLNQSMKSVYKTLKKDSDPPLNFRKRKIIEQ